MDEQPRTPISLAEAVKIRTACHAHASDLIEAAVKLLEHPAKPNLAYHLALLALEEIGKAGLIVGQAAIGSRRDSSRFEKSLSSHSRKLQWAIWSPLTKIDPKQFSQARELAQRMHARRLAGLYVEPLAEFSLPQDAVSLEEAQSIIDLARSRLSIEPLVEVPEDHQAPEVLNWFLETMESPEGLRQLLSSSFVARFEQLGGDAVSWMTWAKSEIERNTAEAEAILRAELARQVGSGNEEQPKWRTRTRVYTASHSIRPKVLKYWNDRVGMVKLISTGKNDEFLLELKIGDAVLLPDLYGYVLGKAKTILAFLSIGSTGLFWFDRPAFKSAILEEVRDLTRPNFKMEIGPKFGYGDSKRLEVLTEQHLQFALECMSVFLPLEEEIAEPIFRPYFEGLSLIAMSGLHVSVDQTARSAFFASLRAVLQYCDAWDGKEATLDVSLDQAFAPIIGEADHRKIMFAALKSVGGGPQPVSEDTLTVKRLVDLYLIWVARRRLQLI
jgi:AbiV family abortive infection protein